ncbi:unnamed protein product, partial [Ectocarpus sp. 8 AP-2014]
VEERHGKGTGRTPRNTPACSRGWGCICTKGVPGKIETQACRTQIRSQATTKVPISPGFSSGTPESVPTLQPPSSPSKGRSGHRLARRIRCLCFAGTKYTTLTSSCV